MKKPSIIGFLTLTLISFLVPATGRAQEMKLWYDRPASHWLEALPIGNSALGAMIYGGVESEEIQLNEETFWSGSPHNNDSPDAKAHIKEVRDLIFDDKELEAQGVIDRHFIKGPHGMRFLPLGSVTLRFPGEGQVSDYRRELNRRPADHRIQGRRSKIHAHRLRFTGRQSHHSPPDRIEERCARFRPLL